MLVVPTKSEWEKEVARAIGVLAREIQVLNPGVVLDFDMGIVEAPNDPDQNMEE